MHLNIVWSTIPLQSMSWICTRDVFCCVKHSVSLRLRFIQAAILFNQPKMTGNECILNDSFCTSHDSNTITSDAPMRNVCRTQSSYFGAGCRSKNRISKIVKRNTWKRKFRMICVYDCLFYDFSLNCLPFTYGATKFSKEKYPLMCIYAQHALAY